MSESAHELLIEAIDARRAGDLDRALSRASQARTCLTPSSSPRLRGQVALVLGNSLADKGQYAAAEEELRRGAETFRSAGWYTEFAQAQISRGRILAEQDMTREALKFFAELERLELPRELRSQVLNNLGLLNRRLGNLGEAIQFLLLDAKLSEEMEDSYGAAIAHFNLAGALGMAERNAEKREHAERAATLFRQAGREDLAAQALGLRVS